MQEVYKKGQMHHHNLQGKECLSKLCEGSYSTGFSYLKIIFDTSQGLTATLSPPVTFRSRTDHRIFLPRYNLVLKLQTA